MPVFPPYRIRHRAVFPPYRIRHRAVFPPYRIRHRAVFPPYRIRHRAVFPPYRRPFIGRNFRPIVRVRSYIQNVGVMLFRGVEDDQAGIHQRTKMITNGVPPEPRFLHERRMAREAPPRDRIRVVRETDQDQRGAGPEPAHIQRPSHRLVAHARAPHCTIRHARCQSPMECSGQCIGLFWIARRNGWAPPVITP